MKNMISVIMPVYQVEKYIQPSVESICKQTYKNFEIILVDDGTKDKSIEIAKQTIEKFKGIKYEIIHQKNKGLSSARNTGIKHANGDWLICIDSDDTINENTLQILSEHIEDDVNAIAFNYLKVKSVYNVSEKILDINLKTYTKDEFLNLFYLRKIDLIVPALLLNKQFIIENNLFYNEDCRFSEDQIFIWNLLLSINKIKYIDNKLYYYLTRVGSIMTASSIDKIKTGFNCFAELNEKLCLLKNNSSNSVDYKLIFPRWILGTLHTAAKYMKYCDYKSLDSIINNNNQIKLLKHYPDKRISLLAKIHCFSKFLFFTIVKHV